MGGHLIHFIQISAKSVWARAHCAHPAPTPLLLKIRFGNWSVLKFSLNSFWKTQTRYDLESRGVRAGWAQWARAHPLFAEIWMKWVKCPPTFSYYNDNIILFEKFLGWKFLCPPTFWRLPTPLMPFFKWNLLSKTASCLKQKKFIEIYHFVVLLLNNFDIYGKNQNSCCVKDLIVAKCLGNLTRWLLMVPQKLNPLKICCL